MDKNGLDFVVEKSKELMSASTCSSEAKAAAQAWLDAVGGKRKRQRSMWKNWKQISCRLTV